MSGLRVPVTSMATWPQVASPTTWMSPLEPHSLSRFSRAGA